MITIALRKKIDNQLKNGVPDPTKYLSDYIEKLKKQPKKQKLSYKYIPWTGWFFGLLCLGLGIFFNYFALMGKHGFLFSELDDG